MGKLIIFIKNEFKIYFLHIFNLHILILFKMNILQKILNIFLTVYSMCGTIRGENLMPIRRYLESRQFFKNDQQDRVATALKG
jgi:hypothetical protein